MPFIAITSRECWIPSSDRYANCVQTAYLRAIEAPGGIPLIIPLIENLGIVRSLYDLCDGILLPGGEDVAPHRYNEVPDPDLGEVHELRDKIELAMTEWALKDRKPILGICRGLQLINVALGGTLHQHLRTGHPHCNITTGEKRWTTLAHEIQIELGTRLYELLGADRIMVNTLHHQAPKEIAPPLRVSARSVPDGVIEAMEWAGDEQEIIAVQCHPEGLAPEIDMRWKRCFEWLVNRAALWRDRTPSS